MADTYLTLGSSGHKKKLIALSDGTYADASYSGARALGTEVVVAGATSHLGLHAAPVNAASIYIRHKPEAGKDVEWRVKSDVVHTVQMFRARSIVDSMTITLASIVDEEAATINGVTFAAEDTAAEALRSAHLFYTGGANDTADAVELVKGINRGVAITHATVAADDTVTIGVDGTDYTYTCAAAAVVPSGIFAAGTNTQSAASLVLCVNHKDTVKFTSDAATWTATDPAVSEANSYATSIELMGDLNTHMADTGFHNQTTAAVSSTAATTEATLIAQVTVARTALLSHFADAAAHNIADATNYAAVLATVVPTTAATAIVCENLLQNAWVAHVATAVPLATDTVTISNGISSTTFTAHASTTTVATHVFSVAGTDSENGDELVSCINDRATITLATCVANDTVVINDLTFTGKTSTAVTRDRRFSVDTSDDATGISLAALINDATYGVPGVTATNSSGTITLIPDYGTTITMSSDFATITCKDAAGVEGITAANVTGTVSLTRNSEDYTVTASTDAGAAHVHNCAQVAVARGIPGVIATSNVAEVDICPSWSSVDGDEITVVPSSDTQTWVRYGIPGVTATSAAGVVTVVPRATNGASVLQSITGTAAGRWAVAYTTLSNLIISAAATTDAAANSTTAGGDYIDTLNGYEYAYLSVTNKSGAGVMTCTVGATDH